MSTEELLLFVLVVVYMRLKQFLYSLSVVLVSLLGDLPFANI